MAYSPFYSSLIRKQFLLQQGIRNPILYTYSFVGKRSKADIKTIAAVT